MRLPASLALTGSVCLLLAVGAIGVEMNRESLRTAEGVHRADALALAINNRALIHQYIRQSAEELTQSLTVNTPSLTVGDQSDADLLAHLVNKSAFFRFGAAFTTLSGQVMSKATGILGLPQLDGAGLQPLFTGVAKGETGVSDVLIEQATPVVAIGVPVVVNGTVHGALLGFTNLRTSILQGFILQLSEGGRKVGIVDGRGIAVADSEQMTIAMPVEPRVAEESRAATGAPSIFEYDSEGRRMVGVVAAGLPGGWAFYQTQLVSEFYGPVRDRSVELNLVLLVLVVLAALSLTFLNHRATAARRRAEARFAALVQNATDMITVLNREGEITYDSPSVSTFLGHAPGHRVGRSLLASVHPEDLATVASRLRALRRGPASIDRFDCRLCRADGSHVWVDLSAANLLHDPAINGIVVNGRDVSDQRRLQEQLSYQAQHDALTGLPNRQVFAERLRAAVASRRLIAVLFVDLDRFKWVNDQWGHDVGDDVLRRVGRRLGDCVRGRDTLARVGGDEFVILLDGIDEEAAALAVAERVVAAMSRPFPLAEGLVRIGASVGISISGAGLDAKRRRMPAIVDAEDLVRAADSAMYRAKQAGGLGYRVAPASASA